MPTKVQKIADRLAKYTEGTEIRVGEYTWRLISAPEKGPRRWQCLGEPQLTKHGLALAETIGELGMKLSDLPPVPERKKRPYQKRARGWNRSASPVEQARAVLEREIVKLDTQCENLRARLAKAQDALSEAHAALAALPVPKEPAPDKEQAA